MGIHCQHDTITSDIPSELDLYCQIQMDVFVSSHMSEDTDAHQEELECIHVDQTISTSKIRS